LGSRSESLDFSAFFYSDLHYELLLGVLGSCGRASLEHASMVWHLWVSCQYHEAVSCEEEYEGDQS
jgi:hypothetical protein